MSLPTLTPTSALSAVVLPSAGSALKVNDTLPYKIYSDPSAPLYSTQFLTGAADQVAYVYKKLGGDILDIELTEGNVYSAYEEAVLEYSYLINVHQASNILSDALGNATGSFDSKGNLMSGELSSSLGGSHVALKYPKFDYGMTRRVAEGVSSEVSLNASVQYSASFGITVGKQDYDLQKILENRLNPSAEGSITFSDSAGNGSTFTLVDTNGNTRKFQFDRATSTSRYNTSPVILGIDTIDNADTAAARAEGVVDLVVTAVNSDTHLKITAKEDPSDAKRIIFTQDKGGSAGNTTITKSSGGLGDATVVNFSGGSDTYPYGSKIDGKRILIKKVFYKTPHAMWRFFGYYGGLNVVGNLSNYGQFSDDSTFQLVPAWHNKAQAMAFEDAIYTRLSHYSYELKDNKIRLHPRPYSGGPAKMWIEFSIPENVWEGDDSLIGGVNNMNTLPIGNLPFPNINSIGKQWIRRFALALSKETLGQVRSKFGSVPIPGETVQLNGSALITEGKDEQEKLREELKTTLAEMTYSKLAEQDSTLLENSSKVLERVPNYIFVG